jgi:predicted site-specific integrase-resolvase
MAWLRPHQVRELVREVLGWEMHPNTLYAWGRSGKIRRLVPGGGRIFYASEDVAAMLGLTHDEVLTIVQKEKGGRP